MQHQADRALTHFPSPTWTTTTSNIFFLVFFTGEDTRHPGELMDIAWNWVQCDVRGLWHESRNQTSSPPQKSATSGVLTPPAFLTDHTALPWGRSNFLVWTKTLPVTGLLYERGVDTCIKLWAVILHCRGEPSPFWQPVRDPVSFQACC